MTGHDPQPDAGRQLLLGQHAELRILDIKTGKCRLVQSFDRLIEAPNWSADGSELIVNADGSLWRVLADGTGSLTSIESRGLPPINNDHLLHPSGESAYVSGRDGHLYEVDLISSKPARRVSNDHAGLHRYYLHGISPDGSTLAYVAREQRAAGVVTTNLFTIPAAGGADQRLTGLDLPHDGPDYSADGAWLYFNSERASPGQAQCFRIPSAGGAVEQLTCDDRVNWFPHPSPNGKDVVYLSFAPGTQGHPANRQVELKLLGAACAPAKVLRSLFGGQGTLNVNSWGPRGGNSHSLSIRSWPAMSVREPLRACLLFHRCNFSMGRSHQRP